MKLFRVRNKKYKEYYVIANDYNEAVLKVETHREVEAKSIIDTDGSLQIPDNSEDDIFDVALMTEDLIT